jgi:hypothetical protein
MNLKEKWQTDIESIKHEKMSDKPIKISFILTARNDDYGGNFLFRLTTSIKVLSFLVRKHNLAAELMIIEYNPPANAEPLAVALNEWKNAGMPIRIVTIPPAFHDKVRQESKTPFLEYVAKNIGIRRARGEYIVTANPDIVFSEELITFLKQGPLDDHAFYRVDRHDMPAHGLDDVVAPEAILQKCPEIANRAWTDHGQEYLKYRRWWKRFLKHPMPDNLRLFPGFNGFRRLLNTFTPTTYHTYASGDFIMAHHSVWEKLQGFDERPFLSHIDGYAIHNLIALGFKQIILPFPIFHINHRESNSQRQMLALTEYKKDAEEISRTKIPKHTGPVNWGAPDEYFEEQVISVNH